MSSKDKTGDRLVASMRKSKTGAVARKAAATSAASKPVATRSARTTSTKPAPSSPADAYSVGHRVWPD